MAIWLLGYRELPTARFHSTFRLLEVHDHEPFSDALELHAVELPNLPQAGTDGTEGRADAVAAVLEACGVALSEAERLRLFEYRDAELLDRWLTRSATAERAADVFGD